MKPYLFYKATDIKEKSSGMGEISEATNVEIHEVLNGEYNLQFDIPKSSRYFHLVNPENLIKIRASQSIDWEVFYINKTIIKKNPDVMTVNAVQYSMLSNSVYVKGTLTIDDKTPQQVLSEMKSMSDLTSQEFEYTSDFKDKFPKLIISYKDSNPNNILIGDSNALVKILDGRLERRFKNINIAKKETGKKIHVRSGRDISGIDIQSDVSNLITSIIPYYEDKNNNSGDDNTRIYGLEVRSPLAGKYANQHRSYIDYSSRVDNLDDLDDLAQRYFEENINVDKPQYTINIDTTTYLNNMQSAEIGDIALVHDASFNLNVELPVTERTYDPVNNKITNLKIGTVDTNVFQILEKRIKDTDNKIDSTNDDVNKKINDNNDEVDDKINNIDDDMKKRIKDYEDATNKIIEDNQKKIDDALKESENKANEIIDEIQNTIDDTRDDLSDFMNSKGSNIIEWEPQLHNATDMRINTNYGYWLLNQNGAGFHNNSGEVLNGLSADGRIIATDIYGNSLTSTTIHGGKIDAGSIAGAKITFGSMEGTAIKSTNIDSSDITGTNITASHIRGTNIDGGSITGNYSIGVDNGSYSVNITPGHISTPELTAGGINMVRGANIANVNTLTTNKLNVNGTASIDNTLYLSRGHMNLGGADISSGGGSLYVNGSMVKTWGNSFSLADIQKQNKLIKNILKTKFPEEYAIQKSIERHTLKLERKQNGR